MNKISKKQIIGSLGLVSLIIVGSLIFLQSKEKNNLIITETAGDESIEITSKIKVSPKNIDSIVSGITEVVKDSFKDTYIKIGNIEKEQYNDLSLIKVNLGVTDDEAKIIEYTKKVMTEKLKKNVNETQVNKTLTSLKKTNRFKEVIEEPLIKELRNEYGDIIDKGLYYVVTDANINKPYRVGDYIETIKPVSLTEKETKYIKILIDYFNYGVSYKANDTEMAVLLDLKKVTKKEVLMNAMIKNFESYRALHAFLIKVYENYKS